MSVTKNGMVVTIRKNVVDSITGLFENEMYSVVLHGLPKYTHHVYAGSADEAHQIALKLAQSEGKCLKLTGATIQRLDVCPPHDLGALRSCRYCGVFIPNEPKL